MPVSRRGRARSPRTATTRGKAPGHGRGLARTALSPGRPRSRLMRRQKSGSRSGTSTSSYSSNSSRCSTKDWAPARRSTSTRTSTSKTSASGSPSRRSLRRYTTMRPSRSGLANLRCLCTTWRISSSPPTKRWTWSPVQATSACLDSRGRASTTPR